MCGFREFKILDIIKEISGYTGEGGCWGGSDKGWIGRVCRMLLGLDL